MVNIRTVNCPEEKRSIKCPYSMTPTRIVIHNTAGDATAAAEIAYMHRNNQKVSFHFAVDDTEIVQGIPLNRNAWHAGDGGGKGNRQGIAIEICYSKSGGERWLKAVENAADLTAKLLKDYGWDLTKVTKHQDYSGKHCPHRILDEYGWDNFLKLVQTKLNGKTPAPSGKISVTYQVWDDIKNKWLPNVNDSEDYAGNLGHDVCAVYAHLSQGNITYKVHTLGGRWLPEVVNREDFAGIFNRPIDGLMMKTDTGRTLHYAAHLRRKNKWLPAVTGYNEKESANGYAGILGQEIDAIRVYLD